MIEMTVSNVDVTADIVEYTYDALGRRIEKKDCVTSVNTRRYFYSKDWQVLDEYSGDATPALENRFVYGNYIDEVLLSWATVTANSRYYVHDHLYSVAAEINTSSAVTERYEYDAYGNPHVLDSNSADDADNLPDNDNPYLFTGRRVDYLNNADLTLQYNRNRYYDYHTGRWLTHDPLGVTPDCVPPVPFDAVSQYHDAMSLYEYVKSGPMHRHDQYGLFTGGSWIPTPITPPDKPKSKKRTTCSNGGNCFYCPKVAELDTKPVKIRRYWYTEYVPWPRFPLFGSHVRRYREVDFQVDTLSTFTIEIVGPTLKEDCTSAPLLSIPYTSWKWPTRHMVDTSLRGPNGRWNPRGTRYLCKRFVKCKAKCRDCNKHEWELEWERQVTGYLAMGGGMEVHCHTTEDPKKLCGDAFFQCKCGHRKKGWY